MVDARGRSTASILALVLAGLILYASLYPFGPWRLQGVDPWGWVDAPWSPYWTGFDVIANLVGYVPLGFLLVVGQMRRQAAAWCCVLAALVPALLSFGIESVQSFLPMRVPSRLDWVLNSAGGLLGGWLAWWLIRSPVQQRWDQLRRRWFEPQAKGTLVLLTLWPFALLYPASVPFGLGQVAERLGALAERVLAGTPWQAWWASGAPAVAPLDPLAEVICMALGLLAPVLLAFSDMRSRSRRLWLMLALFAVGVSVSALSAALTWGPAHAWSWLGPAWWQGLGLASVAGLVAVWLPRRWCAALLLLALGVLLTALNRAPASPYLAESLQLWEQGRFIRFHGLSQWLGWLWPYAVLMHGLVLLFRRPAAGTNPSRN